MQRHRDTDLPRSELRQLGVGRHREFTARVEMYALDGSNWRVRLRDVRTGGQQVASHCFLYAEDVHGGQPVLDRIGSRKGTVISFTGHVKLYNCARGLGYKIGLDVLS